jgi:hypothetical protein
LPLEELQVQLVDLRMTEVGFFDHHTAILGLIAFAGEVIAFMPHFAENLGPLERFE